VHGHHLLPDWCDELKRRYVRGEACQFVLHGNVHDLILHDGKLHGLVDFLGNVLLASSRDVVAHLQPVLGVRFLKKQGEVVGLDELVLEKSADKVLPAARAPPVDARQGRRHHGLRRDAGARRVTPTSSPKADRQSVIGLHRWSMSPIIEASDNLRPHHHREPHRAESEARRQPAHGEPAHPHAGRRDAARCRQAGGAALRAPPGRKRLSEVTAGLKSVQIQSVLGPTPHGAEDPTSTAEREKLIMSLLATARRPRQEARRAHQGMSLDEVARAGGADGDLAQEPERTRATKAEVLKLIYKRKREIIERECYGLIEFVESAHDFSVVGGIEEVKTELLAIAAHLREGRKNRCPMGLLFTGRWAPARPSSPRPSSRRPGSPRSS